MAGQFRSSVWDPILITAQIITVQCVFYISLGFWTFIIDFIGGLTRSLDQLFIYQALHFKASTGKLIMMAYVLNALAGSLGLWYVVQRTKQCLDFAVTCHLIHLITCWIFNAAFPSTLSWWLINVISVILMTVLGEFLCMRTELKAIPINIGPRVDL